MINYIIIIDMIQNQVQESYLPAEGQNREEMEMLDGKIPMFINYTV